MRWGSNLAYIVGLITTDGSLSKDARHIDFTSKDLEQVKTFAKILGLKNKIGFKKSSYNPQGKYYHIQFGNVEFYRFLLKIGLFSNKTKTIAELAIPNRYFADFLRGHLDGDGYTSSFWDSRWKNSFRLYTGFTSASRKHVEWLSHQIKRLYQIQGIIRYKGKSTFELQFAKRSSVILLKKMYYEEDLPYLKRKYSKILSALDIISEQAGVLKLVDRLD